MQLSRGSTPTNTQGLGADSSSLPADSRLHFSQHRPPASSRGESMAEAILIEAGKMVISAVLDHGIRWASDAAGKRRQLVEAAKEGQKLDEEPEKERRKLVDNMMIIQGVLRDAESRQHSDSAVRSWLRQLGDVFYDAEDVLDEYDTDLATAVGNTVVEATGADNTLEAEGSRKSFFRCCFSRASIEDHDSHVAAQLNLSKYANAIKEINERVEDLEKRRLRLGLRVLDAPVQVMPKFNLEGRETTSRLIQQPLGRDGVKTEIINRIVKAEGVGEAVGEGTSHFSIKSGRVSVLPILGMGGVGKTTLAKMVFDDDEVKKCFDLTVWVCVSEDFRTKLTSLQQLEPELVELLEGKQVLLVLDDVWNDQMDPWDQLLETFTAACNDKGGRIVTLVTTRLASVAKAIQGCMEPIHLKGLEEEQFWDVFKLYAFGPNSNLEDNKRRALEPVGRSIAKRLKGLPLAAKFIGRILASDYSVDHWNKIMAIDLCTLEQKEQRKGSSTSILSILRLSYDHLPGHLKQCLVYFSLFPKDYVFEEYEIIHVDGQQRDPV